MSPLLILLRYRDRNISRRLLASVSEQLHRPSLKVPSQMTTNGSSYQSSSNANPEISSSKKLVFLLWVKSWISQRMSRNLKKLALLTELLLMGSESRSVTVFDSSISCSEGSSSTKPMQDRTVSNCLELSISPMQRCAKAFLNSRQKLLKTQAAELAAHMEIFLFILIVILINQLRDCQFVIQLSIHLILQIHPSIVMPTLIEIILLSIRGMHIISLCFFVTLVIAHTPIQQANTRQQVMRVYDRFSFKPLLHLHFNTHYKQSKYFQPLEDALKQLQQDRSGYMEILYTDCDAVEDNNIAECSELAKSKDSHKIYGTIPSSFFNNIGRIKIQSPPTKKVLHHPGDTHQVAGLNTFMDQLLPNLFLQINNSDQYEQLLKTRHVPKLILFQVEDEVVSDEFKKLSISQALRFDMGMITDLNQQLVSRFQIQSYPSLAVVKYDYQSGLNSIIYYDGEIDYEDLNNFASAHALKEPRNDVIFHKIFIEEDSPVHVASSEGQLKELKDRLAGWSIIERATDKQIPTRLLKLQQLYGRYFNYIHDTSRKETGQTEVYFPSLNQSFYFGEEGFDYKTTSAHKIIQNAQYLISKGFTIFIVKEENGHICGVAEKPLFLDKVKCFIVDSKEQTSLEKQFRSQIKYGLIIRNVWQKESRQQKVQALVCPSGSYESVYSILDKAVREEIIEQVTTYMNTPLSQVKAEVRLQELCNHPTKQCFFLLTNLRRTDRTIQAYIKEEAFNFINSYSFYEIDYSENKDLVKAFGGEPSGLKPDLVVYNPRSMEYTRLNKKVSKQLIRQFLKANLIHDARLAPTKIDHATLIVKPISRKVQSVEEL